MVEVSLGRVPSLSEVSSVVEVGRPGLGSGGIGEPRSPHTRWHPGGGTSACKAQPQINPEMKREPIYSLGASKSSYL